MKLLKDIKKIVERFPNQKCLTINNESLTYEEFWKLCLNFANEINLRSKKNKIICIREKDNFFDYVAIIGTLIAGGTYVPINRLMPANKIYNIVEKVKPEFIFDFKISSKNIINLDKKFLFKKKDSKRIKSTKNNKTAYILYTSGTTGEPKGVIISKKSLDTYVDWLKNNIRVNLGSRVSQIPSIGFDLSVADIYLSLVKGGELVVPNKYETLFLGKYIEKNKINHLVCTPSIIDYISSSDHLKKKYLKSLNSIFFCGEILYEHQVIKLFNLNKKLSIINAYGPTEATCSMSYCKIDSLNFKLYSNGSIAIGKPNTNMSLKIEKNNTKTKDSIGELFISGPQLSEGYFGNRAETKKKFIKKNGKVYFKTGDIVKKIKKNIYFVNRIDDQIKIKGYRIELQEINSYLIKYGFSQSHTLIIDKQLVSFVKGNKLISKKLFLFLKEYLEEYKLPNKIIKIDCFLINKNNKIDLNYLKKIYEKKKLKKIISKFLLKF